MCDSGLYREDPTCSARDEHPAGASAGAERKPRGLALAAVGALTATLLSACGDDGKPQLNWYINPDGVETFKKWAEECSTSEYDIVTQDLPTSATDQRVQLARRLAAEDPSTDLMNLDPVFVAGVRQRRMAGRGRG